jgi:hypothetical protein
MVPRRTAPRLSIVTCRCSVLSCLFLDRMNVQSNMDLAPSTPTLAQAKDVSKMLELADTFPDDRERAIDLAL